MKLIHAISRIGAVLALGAAVSLSAADTGPAFEFKLRAGLTAGALRTAHGDNKAMAFGVGVRSPFRGGFLTAEVSFDLLPGQALDQTPLDGPVYAPAGTSLGTADPVTHKPYFLRVNESLDLRKESSQGFSLKGGYAAPTGWAEGLSWQAGISLDFAKVSSEFTGTLRPMVLSGTSPLQVKDAAGRNYYEGFAIVQKEAALTPGFYLGLRQELSPDFAVEAHVRNLGARHFDYHPTTYTGATAVMESSTKRGFVFDVGLALTF